MSGEMSFEKSLEYIKEKTIFFHRIANDRDELYKEINNLEPTKIKILTESLEKNLGGSTTILRYVVLKALEQNVEITDGFVNDVKDKFRNRDSIFFGKYVGKDVIEKIESYKTNKGGNPFTNWTKPFSIFYVYFNDAETKSIVESCMKTISENFLAQIKLDDFDVKYSSFDGTQNYGQSHVGFCAYPKELKDYKNAIQLHCNIIDGNFVGGIYKGTNVKESPEISSVIQEKRYSTFDDLVHGLDLLKGTVIEINNIIAKTDYYVEKKEPVLDEVNEAGKERIPLNQILYGPPGTGKTYSTKDLLERIVGDQLKISLDKKSKLVNIFQQFGSTWYDSIALAMYSNGKAKKYKVEDITKLDEVLAFIGIRKSVSFKNTIWRELQTHTDPTVDTVGASNRREPYLFTKDNDSYWSLTKSGVEYIENNLSELLIELNKDETTDINDFYKFITFHQSYSYEEFVEGLKPSVAENGKDILYSVESGIFKKMCDRASVNTDLNYVLIIDEINRGEISKIFGELITLIEPDKRIGCKNELKVTLPYSGETFGVPKNLYIIGTMNTADRSIALLDIALRRRFDFIPMYPDSSVIENNSDLIEEHNIDLRCLLDTLNDRIEALRSKDYTIGHSYFMGIDSSDILRERFNSRIIPLLEEYFYNDYELIAKVLKQGDVWNGEDVIIHKREVFENYVKYSINADYSMDAIKRIYE